MGNRVRTGVALSVATSGDNLYIWQASFFGRTMECSLCGTYYDTYDVTVLTFNSGGTKTLNPETLKYVKADIACFQYPRSDQAQKFAGSVFRTESYAAADLMTVYNSTIYEFIGSSSGDNLDDNGGRHASLRTTLKHKILQKTIIVENTKVFGTVQNTSDKRIPALILDDVKNDVVIIAGTFDISTATGSDIRWDDGSYVAGAGTVLSSQGGVQHGVQSNGNPFDVKTAGPYPTAIKAIPAGMAAAVPRVYGPDNIFFRNTVLKEVKCSRLDKIEEKFRFKQHAVYMATFGI